MRRFLQFLTSATLLATAAQLEAQPTPQTGSQLGFVSLNSYPFSPSAPPGGFSPLGLVLGQDGNLYGTLEFGGQYNEGAIFCAETNGTTLWTLPLTGAEGPSPFSLLQGQDGNLYGLGYGEIFSVGTNQIFQWALAATNNGNVNFLVQGQDGNLYGTCTAGGTGSGSGNGQIVSVSTNGDYNWVYVFNTTNGAKPEGALIEGTDGNLYGTTFNGGKYSEGTVFSLFTNGTLNWEFSFKGNNGQNPMGALVQGVDGRLYGTTSSGGATFSGTAFSITTNGIMDWFYSLPNTNQFATPNGSALQGTDGNLYFGAKDVFSLTTNGVFRWSAPLDGTVLLQRLDGSLYGLDLNNSGVFCITTNGQTNGVSALTNSFLSTLVQDSQGNIYGTATSQSTTKGGQLFELVAAPWIFQAPQSVMDLSDAPATFTVAAVGSPTLTYQWERNGTPLVDGYEIFGSHSNTLVISPVSDSDAASYTVVVSNYFGMTSNYYTFGSTNAATANLSLTNSFPTLVSNGTFSVPNPALYATVRYPGFLTALPDGFLYGSTVASQFFKIDTNGVLQWSDGVGIFAYPTSLVLGSDGNIYGTGGLGLLIAATNGTIISNMLSMGSGLPSGIAQEPGLRFVSTYFGGQSYPHGAIRSFAPDGSNYWVFSFNVTNGASPSSVLLSADTHLYGTTEQGGTNGDGTVFSMDTNGNLLWSYSFTENFGRPSSLIQGGDGNLYGTSLAISNNGSLFSITTNGTVNWILPLDVTDGALPNAPLLWATDGNLYGVTRGGGSAGIGTIFQLTTNGAITTLYNFSGGSDGEEPEGGIVQTSDGSLYGTTTFGGPNNVGVFYRLDLGLPPLPVTTLPPTPTGPTIENITLGAGMVSFTWGAQSNQTYQVQYKDDLTAPTWNNLGTSITATNTTVTVSDNISDAQRFYRAVLLGTP